MSISFADIVQAGVGVIALFILYSFIQNTAKDNERRDKSELAERDRRDRSDDRSALLYATLTGKQIEGTAQVIKSGVDSEARVTAQSVASEAAIKLRVQAVGDAQLSAIELLYRLTDNGFKSLLANPQDPTALAKVQRAIELLTATVQAVQEDLTGAKADIASNTETGVANTTAITDAATALAATTPPAPADAPAPAEVVVADISPTAIASIVGAVTPKTDAGDGDTSELEKSA